MNPIEIYWHERTKNLSLETQNKLIALHKKGHMTDELIFIQRKRPKLQKGDVFVVQPKENTFFYGLILNVCSTPCCKCKIIACIFKNKTHQKTMDDFKIDFNNLLLPPLVLFKEPWISGYFYNVGRINLEEIDIPSYGFYHSTTNTIVSEIGERMCKMPCLIGESAYGDTGSVAYEITMELIIQPDLLLCNKSPEQADFCIKFPNILKKQGFEF